MVKETPITRIRNAAAKFCFNRENVTTKIHLNLICYTVDSIAGLVKRLGKPENFLSIRDL